MAVRVLVVEDEDSLRRTIVRNLERRGYEVREARTVAWAADACTAEYPDVLVLDINLPDGSGWDVLRQLAVRGVMQPRGVVMSAVPPTRKRLDEFGPITFLAKPFPSEALLRAVERAVKVESGHEYVDHSAL